MRLREGAGLDDVRLHDLRHTFGSHVVNSGEALPVLGGVLGHRSVQTPQRYAHLANVPLQQTAERVSAVIASALSSPS